MRQDFRRAALLTAPWALGGCNMLVGLDGVNIVPGGSGGAGDTTSAQAGEGGAATTSGGTGKTGDTGGEGATMIPNGASGAGGAMTSSGAGAMGGATTSSGAGATTSSSSGGSLCGDGVTSGGEGCDDGNATSGDGCSGGCSVEQGYHCSGTPSACTAVCGDGLFKGVEQCDDGNASGGDGCSAECQVEPLHQCEDSAPGTCTIEETLCGDGADGDADSLSDSADPDCALPPYTPAQPCSVLRIYRSVNVPKDIPDAGSGEARSTIFVPDDVNVAHTALVFDITHPRASDLDVTLIPPFGTPRNATSGNGGSGADYHQTVLDGACPISVTLGGAPFDACYKPESFLPSGGQPAKGAWTLEVKDQASGEIGTLGGWSLLLCVQ